MVLIIFDIKGKGILFNQCLQCDRALAHSIFIPFFWNAHYSPYSVDEETESHGSLLVLVGSTNDGYQSLDSDPDLSHSQVHTSPILPDYLSKVVKSWGLKYVNIYFTHSEEALLSFQYTVSSAGLMAFSCLVERETRAKWPDPTRLPLKADPRFGFQFAECKSKLSPHHCELNFAKLIMILINTSLPFCRGFLQVIDCLQYQYKWMN